MQKRALIFATVWLRACVLRYKCLWREQSE
jgi:hypothetical protein